MAKLHKYLHQPHDFEYLKVDKSHMYYVASATVVDNTDGTETIVFPDVDVVNNLANFKPKFSPKRMIQDGVFGGLYFGSCKPDTLYQLGLKQRMLLPDDWFENVYQSDTKQNCKTNKFGVCAGLDRTWWINSKLIADSDPLGWFEWYCHFFLGRRIPKEDQRQIQRWIQYCKRHVNMAKKNKSGLTPRYQQSLFQWAEFVK